MLDVLFLYEILNYMTDSPELLHQINFRINTKNTRTKDLFKPRFAHCNVSKTTTITRLLTLGNQKAEELDLDFFADSLEVLKSKLISKHQKPGA